MSVTSMLPRTSPQLKFHLESDEMEVGAGWQFMPGLSVRDLFSDREGYRVTLTRFSEGHMEPERFLTGDEHVFVLSGFLADSSAEYGPGSYLLNPAGLRPRLWSQGGCSLIIHQVPAAKQNKSPERVNLPSSRSLMEAQSGFSFPSESGWEELRPGVFMLPLFEGPPGKFKSALQRFQPGAYLPEHIHTGDEHTFMIEGSQEDETGCYDTGSYAFNPIGTSHQVWSEEGCLALVHWRAPVRFLD